MAETVAKLPLRQVQSVQQLLKNDAARGQLAAVAAGHMKPERMMRVVANAIRTTPKLQECEPISFLGALMQCAALGLEPNTVLGHAYLVPFKNNKKKVTEVQVIVGYKGLIDLARRSGHITSISANVHYSDDDLWDYEEGTEARLRHRPGPQEGDKLHAYAIAKFTDGGHAYVVLPWAVVMKTRNGSQNWQSAVKFNSTDRNPWTTHEDAMAKKTAIRALSKYLPLSVEFMDAVQIDNDAGIQADFAGYAMNPDDGVTIDGEVTDADEATEETPKDDDTKTEQKPEAKQEAKPKAQTKGKATAKEKEPAPKEAEQPEPEAKGPTNDEMFAKLVDMVKTELENVTDQGEIEGVMEMYANEIEQMKGTPFFDQIQEAADERREALA